jgi:hypothetical protein
VQAIVDRLQTSEDPLAVQREMLLEVLDGLDRQPQDVALFGVAAAQHLLTRQYPCKVVEIL